MKNKQWFRVKAPKAWRAQPGDELIGEYLGIEMRYGQFGDYKAHKVKSKGQVYYASGAQLNDLFSVVNEGMVVKLVYVGIKTSANERQYKVYELYTEEAIKLKVAS